MYYIIFAAPALRHLSMLGAAFQNELETARRVTYTNINIEFNREAHKEVGNRRASRRLVIPANLRKHRLADAFRDQPESYRQYDSGEILATKAK